MNTLTDRAMTTLAYLDGHPGTTTYMVRKGALRGDHAIVLLLDLRDLGLVTCRSDRWTLTEAGLIARCTGSV